MNITVHCNCSQSTSMIMEYHCPTAVGVSGLSGLVMLVSAVALLVAVVKFKQHKPEELKPLMDPDLPTALVHQYYARKRAEVHGGMADH